MNEAMNTNTGTTSTHKSDSPVLFCYGFDGKGNGTALTGQAVADTLKANQLAWVNIDRTHPQAAHWLHENIGYLDDIIIDALLTAETRPRLTEFEDGAMVILRGVNLNENAEPEDMISIRMWVDPHRIITVQNRNLRAIQDVRERLQDGTGPKNCADFLTLLSSRLFIRMEPAVNELDDEIDAMEERILADHTDISCRHALIDIRQRALIFRRFIAPQKDLTANLRSSELPWLDTVHRRQLQENLDRLSRYIEELDSARDRAQIIKDELASIMADKMNKNMYVLSIVAAIFLPLGFLTGLMGINVGGMPGVDNAMGFWIVAGLCIAFGVGCLALFKWLKWV